MVLHRRCTGKLKTFVSRDELKECLTTCGAVLTETLAEGVDYEKTFPLAGIDGTMKKRLKNSVASGRARIKTGYLNGVRSAAGYVFDPQGGRYAVSVLINDPRAADGVAAIDALLDWLAAGGR